MDRLSIGEVCSLLQVKPHIVRYWEQGIDLLSPRKDFSGRRSYSDHDVQILSRVKYLVQERRFTLEGARERIYAELSGASGERNASRKASLQQVRHELLQAGRLLAQFRRTPAGSSASRSLAPLLRLQVLRPVSGEKNAMVGTATSTAAVTVIGTQAVDFDWQTQVRAVLAGGIGRYAAFRVIFCPPELAVAVEEEARRVADAEIGRAAVFACESSNVLRVLEQLRSGPAGRELYGRGVRDLIFLPPDGPDASRAARHLLNLHRRFGACLTLQASRNARGVSSTDGSSGIRYRMTGAIALELRDWRKNRESVPFTGKPESVENRAGGAYSGDGTRLLDLARSVPCGIIVEYP